MTQFIPVTPDFAVAGQLTPEDFAAAHAGGYRLVINNRPDGEQPGQLTAAQGAQAAQAAGLGYLHLPFQGQPPADVVEKMIEALEGAQGPVLAHCRSGTRSITAWALASAISAKHDPVEIVQAADAAGYDLSGLLPVLQRLSGA
jgi:uncharacterized protein (TIGR01244 family)